MFTSTCFKPNFALLLGLVSLILLAFAPANANSVSQVKAYLKQRDKIPKLYMPQQALIDSEVDLVVHAPGAKRIVLLASEPFNGTGVTLSDKIQLMLAEDYREIGAKDLAEDESRARFSFKFEEDKYKHLLNKNYFFEALVTYDFYGE